MKLPQTVSCLAVETDSISVVESSAVRYDVVLRVRLSAESALDAADAANEGALYGGVPLYLTRDDAKRLRKALKVALEGDLD